MLAERLSVGCYEILWFAGSLAAACAMIRMVL